MKRNPGIIDTCRQIILEKWTKVYNEIQRKLMHNKADAIAG
jgi:hypothetical protein